VSALSGHVAVVTGGRRGIGAALRGALERAGAIVEVTSRTTGPGVHAVDLGDEASVRSFFDQILDRHGRLDLLVNNAGRSVVGPIEELSVADFREVIDVTLLGAFLCSREAFRRMRGGRIINIGSIVDNRGLPGNAAYGTAKFGLRGLGAGLAEEGPAKGIGVTHVGLGAVATDMTSGRFDPADMLTPEEVADVIAELAAKPPRVRIDEIRLSPAKGLL